MLSVRTLVYSVDALNVPTKAKEVLCEHISLYEQHKY